MSRFNDWHKQDQDPDFTKYIQNFPGGASSIMGILSKTDEWNKIWGTKKGIPYMNCTQEDVYKWQKTWLEIFMAAIEELNVHNGKLRT